MRRRQGTGPSGRASRSRCTAKTPGRGRVEAARRLEGLERRRVDADARPEALRRGGRLGRVGRDALGVVAERRQPREGRPEADPHFQQARGRGRQAREEQRGRSLLRRGDRVARRLEETVVHGLRASLFPRQDVQEHVQGKGEVAVPQHRRRILSEGPDKLGRAADDFPLRHPRRGPTPGGARAPHAARVLRPARRAGRRAAVSQVRELSEDRLLQGARRAQQGAVAAGGGARARARHGLGGQPRGGRGVGGARGRLLGGRRHADRRAALQDRRGARLRRRDRAAPRPADALRQAARGPGRARPDVRPSLRRPGRARRRRHGGPRDRRGFCGGRGRRRAGGRRRAARRRRLGGEAAAAPGARRRRRARRGPGPRAGPRGRKAGPRDAAGDARRRHDAAFRRRAAARDRARGGGRDRHRDRGGDPRGDAPADDAGQALRRGIGRGGDGGVDRGEDQAGAGHPRRRDRVGGQRGPGSNRRADPSPSVP